MCSCCVYQLFALWKSPGLPVCILSSLSTFGSHSHIMSSLSKYCVIVIACLIILYAENPPCGKHSCVIRTRCFVSALQLPMSLCRLYCPYTLSHLAHSSYSHMIRCMLLSDIPHVWVVSGTLDLTPCFLDMLHVGGIWHIGHDIMLLTCVLLVIRT